MPTSSKNAKNTDLSAILEGLIKSDIRFILVGGLAAVIQGAPVTTMDVDIVYEQSPENISRLFKFLRSVEARYRRPDDKMIAPKESELPETKHGLFTTIFGPFDVLSFIEDGKTYEDLIEHTVEIEFRGHRIHVLDLRMLTELKRRSKEPKDRQRLQVLEETLKQLRKDSG